MIGFKDNNCPNCGASLRIDGRRRICEYCGYQGMAPEPEVSDDFYNLIVFNESIAPGDIKISIPDCNIGYIVRGGEAVAKDVPPGVHDVMVTSDGMTEYRTLNVPGDGKAVKIYVAKGPLGLAVRVEDPGGNGGFSSRGAALNQQRTMPILALVFTIIFPLVGLVFAIVDAVTSKKQGRKLNGLTAAAFVILGIRLLLYIVFSIIMVFYTIYH